VQRCSVKVGCSSRLFKLNQSQNHEEISWSGEWVLHLRIYPENKVEMIGHNLPFGHKRSLCCPFYMKLN